ncbi:hypothetical protein VZT92_025175 [Zoarces viviparus]|uniref:Uncharacterized protein n=1 Tax=Zoarces viviparus TaxID=48416 RepID=A0AAW1E4Z7_ZOAVI
MAANMSLQGEIRTLKDIIEDECAQKAALQTENMRLSVIYDIMEVNYRDLQQALGGLRFESCILLETNQDLQRNNKELQNKNKILQTKSDELQMRIDELLTKVDELLTTSDELLTKVDELLTTSDELPTNVDEIPTTIDELPTKVDELLTTSDELPTNVDELLTTSDELPTNVDEIPTTIDELPTKVDEILTTSDELPTKVDELLTTSDELPTKVDEILTTSDELLKKKDKLKPIIKYPKLFAKHALPYQCFEAVEKEKAEKSDKRERLLLPQEDFCPKAPKVSLWRKFKDFCKRHLRKKSKPESSTRQMTSEADPPPGCSYMNLDGWLERIT